MQIHERGLASQCVLPGLRSSTNFTLWEAALRYTKSIEELQILSSGGQMIPPPFARVLSESVVSFSGSTSQAQSKWSDTQFNLHAIMQPLNWRIQPYFQRAGASGPRWTLIYEPNHRSREDFRRLSWKGIVYCRYQPTIGEYSWEIQELSLASWL